MKTEELKALGLTDDQVQRVFALHGADVNREKQAAATAVAERDTLRSQLADANKKLEGYDPDWKQKAADTQQAADEKIAALQAGYAAQNAAAGLKFTSESARKAFLADLNAKKLPLQDGSLLGFDDFVKSYKESDPLAFAAEVTCRALRRARPAARYSRPAANRPMQRCVLRLAMERSKKLCRMSLIVPAPRR